MALSVPGSAGDKRHGPRARQGCTQDDEEPGPPDPGRSEGEWQREREHRDEISGHCPGIGAATGEREPVRGLTENRAERVFPDAERLVELALRDDERDQHADAVRVDP